MKTTFFLFFILISVSSFSQSGNWIPTEKDLGEIAIAIENPTTIEGGEYYNIDILHFVEEGFYVPIRRPNETTVHYLYIEETTETWDGKLDTKHSATYQWRHNVDYRREQRLRSGFYDRNCNCMFKELGTIKNYSLTFYHCEKDGDKWFCSKIVRTLIENGKEKQD